MIKRWAGLAVVLGLIALAFLRCGSTANTPPAPVQQGVLDVTVGDVPLCDILSFRGLVTALTLKTATTTGNGPAVTLSTTGEWVDFGNLQNTSTLLAQTTFQPGTYTGGTITVNAPQMTVYDPSQNPPLATITPTFSQETNIPFSINPPLVVKSNKTSVLRVDFNIPQSVPASAQGQLNIGGSPGAATLKVTPVFNGQALIANSDGSFGDVDDLSGFTGSVSTTSANAKFIGSFALETLSGTSSTAQGPAITVFVTNNTQLVGASALNQITTGNYTEVDGYIDADGNFVANTAVIEDQSDLSNQFAAFIGYVLSTQSDAAGNVTGFQMTVRDEEPNTGNGSSNPVPLDSPPVVVNVSSATGFHFSSPSTNFANLIPDSTYLTAGQQVVVEGTYTPPPSTTGSTGSPAASQSTINAQDIYLPLQTIRGNFTSLLAAGLDNLSGGFAFAPCPTLFQGTPIYIITDAQTVFSNVSGLAALTGARTLTVRGLLVLDHQGGTIENVQIPPGSLLMLAKQVTQL